jgi:fibronectin-binding autotransporter adhesin
VGNYPAGDKKPWNATRTFRVGFAILLGSALAARAPAATITKKDDTNNLNAKASWGPGGPPGSTDIALWDSTVTGANVTSLGANLSWLGIQITNPGGPVTINAGNTLTLGASGINMSAATQDFTLNCALTLGTGQIWDVTTGRMITTTGIIGGSGALTKNGLGTVSLTGVNTYTGGTTINAGTVAINSASSLGASTGTATINAGTLELLTGNTASSTRSFKLGNAASTFQIDASSSFTIGGTISNAATPGGLTKTGTGTLNLTGVNTFGGTGQTVTFLGGIVQVSTDTNLGNAANSLTFNGGTEMFLSGFSSARAVSLTGSGTFDTNNNSVGLTGTISGAGAFTKTGAGTLTLSGTNTFSGGTTITGGNSSVVSIASSANLGSGAVTINGGSVLLSTADLTLSHGVVLGAQGGGNQGDGSPVSGIFNVATGTTLTISSGVISEATAGTGRLEKIGGGTLFITTADTFSGGTYLHDGTIVVANATALGPPTGVYPNALTIDNSAQLVLAATGVFNLPIFIGNGGGRVGALSSSNVAFDNGLISNVTAQSGGFTIQSGINGIGGANTFVGNVSVNGGAALSISRDANLGAASNQLFLGSNSILKIEDGVNIVSNTSVQATFATSRQINLTGGLATIEVDNTYNATNPLPSTLGAHTNILTLNGFVTGTGGLVKTGLGTLILGNQANNYIGGTTINAGILSTTSAGAVGDASSSLTINPTGIYQVTGSFTTSRAVVLGGTGGPSSGGTFDVTGGVTESRDGVISGSGSLTKTGSGTLELGAVNTYTGNTFINGGTLATTNNQSLGPQPTLGSSLYAVHLANGTTLRSLESSTSGTRQVELVSGSATFDIGTSFIQQRDGLIYGSGGLIKTGSGTQILTNANTYTGGTTINGGMLQINNASGSGTGTGTVTVNSGATLSGLPTATGFASPGSISGVVTVNSGGAIDIRSGGTFTFGGLNLAASAITNFQLGSLTTTSVINVTGTNGLSLQGLSTINISNFAGGLAAGTYHLFDYSGTALANLNNLQLGSTAGGAFTYSLSNNQTNTSIDLIVSAAGSSQWGNDASGNWSTASNWTSGVPPNSAGAAANFLGVINSSRTVTVDGAFTSGTLTFNNANSYTIATDGVSGHGVTLNNNGSASISVLAGSHTISAPIALADNVEIAANGGTLLTLSGPISENSAGRTVTISGTGTVTFSGGNANTYTGVTDVDAGTLNLNKTGGVNAIGPGGLEIDLGATVALLGSNQIADTSFVTANGTFSLGASLSETIGSLNGNGNVTIGSGSVLTIGANDGNSEWHGVISGGGTITKTGSGTLELDGVNTFGGAGQTITLLGGSVLVTSDSNFGNAANSLTFNGGAELFAAGFSTARAIILAGNGSFNTANNDDTLSGTISGPGGFTKTGTGTLIVSGANTYSGGTILNAGTLSITSNGNLGTGSVQLNNGSTLLTNGNFNFTHGFVLGAPTGPVQTDGLPVSGIINVQSGTLTETTFGITDGGAGGRLMKIGPGTLDLQVGSPATGGDTAFTGGIYLHEGTLKISTTFAGGTNAVLTIDNAATLIVNASSGGVRSVGQFKLGNGGAFVGETSGNTSFGNGVVSNINGQSGGVTFIGPGKNGLGGNNTFLGTIAIGNPATPFVPAILSISRDVNLGAAGNQLSIGNGSTLMIEDGIDATQPVGSAAIAATFSTSRQFNLTGSTAIIDVENTGDAVNYNPAFNLGGLNILASHTNVLTMNGLITGSGQLIKAGPGTLVLTNTSNNYTGGTMINGGTLSVSDPAALGASSNLLTINPTGVLQTTASSSSSRAVTLGGTGTSSSGGTFDVTGSNIETRTGVISGSGSLTKTGTGTLTLLASNNYTGGTYLNSGTLAINNNSSLGNASGPATIGNATLEVLSDVTSTRNFSVTNANSTFQVDSGATYAFNGIVSGTGSINKTGDGILLVGGNNSYSGGTTINAGTIALTSASSLGPSSGTLTVNAGTLEIVTGFSSSRNIALGNNASRIQVDSGQTYSLSGTLSGSGSLNKDGAGTLSLTGANTFTGATVINAGTLAVSAVSGNALANTSGIVVNAGGSLLLGANDQIPNAVPVTLVGGTIAMGGFSEGSATTVGLGAVTLAGTGSHIDFGTGVVGVLSVATLIAGTDILQIDNWTGMPNASGNGSTDRLIFNSDQSANLGSFSFTGYSGATEFDLGSGFYEVTPLDVTGVPEPSTWCGAVLALLAVAFSQRRRCNISRRR